jgi:hypothetical protein
MHYWDKHPDGANGTLIKASILKNLIKIQQGEHEDQSFQMTLNVLHNQLRERKLVAMFYDELRRKRDLHKRSINEKNLGLDDSEIEGLAWSAQRQSQQTITSMILKLHFAVLVREMDSRIERALQKLAEDMRQTKFNLKNQVRVTKIKSALTTLGKELDAMELARA